MGKRFGREHPDVRAILRSQTGAPLKLIEGSKTKVDGQGQ